MVRVGLIFEIPLSDDRKAFGQYIKRDRMGPIIKVFDLIVRERPVTSEILQSDILFPPVITGFFAALRTGFSHAIGFSKVVNIKYPGFVSTFYDEKTGKASVGNTGMAKNQFRLEENFLPGTRIKNI